MNRTKCFKKSICHKIWKKIFVSTGNNIQTGKIKSEHSKFVNKEILFVFGAHAVL